MPLLRPLNDSCKIFRAINDVDHEWLVEGEKKVILPSLRVARYCCFEFWLAAGSELTLVTTGEDKIDGDYRSIRASETGSHKIVATRDGYITDFDYEPIEEALVAASEATE